MVPRIFRSRITPPTRPPMWWPASASRDRREFLSLRSGVHCFWRFVSASRHPVGQRILAPQEIRPWKISASHGRRKIWGGERHVHISRNREQTREYHEIAITSSTRRWNVMASIGSRSGIVFYRYRALADFLLYQARVRRAISLCSVFTWSHSTRSLRSRNRWR